MCWIFGRGDDRGRRIRAPRTWSEAGLLGRVTLHYVTWGTAEVARLLLDEESDGEIRLADVNAERVMSALTG